MGEPTETVTPPAPKVSTSAARHAKMLSSWFDKSATRATRWYALEFCMRETEKYAHFSMIVAFLVLTIFACLGKPYETPEICMQLFYVTLLVAGVKAALKTIKRVYLGQLNLDFSTVERNKVEVLITVAISTVCIFLALWMNFYSRGYLLMLESGVIDYQRWIMVWTYWCFKFLLMHMYGIFTGIVFLILAFTGCFCGFCCNCCCRGPLFAFLRYFFRRKKQRMMTFREVEQQKAKGVAALRAKGKKKRATDVAEPAPAAEEMWATPRTVLATRVFELADDIDRPSKDGPPPIIDFVENKSQISCLTPIIFVYTFALGSALVMCGSSLIGPQDTLPLAPQPTGPTQIRALCRSPVTGLLLDQFGSRMGPKFAFVGLHLGWTAMLEPPADQCEDLVARDNDALARAFDFQIDWSTCRSPAGFRPPLRSTFPPWSAHLAPCDFLNRVFSESMQLPGYLGPSDLDPWLAIAKYVPEVERARRWSVATAIPTAPQIAGGATSVVAVPPLYMSIQDENVVGVPSVNVSARIIAFSGTCAATSGMPTLVEDTSNTTDRVGVASLALTLDTTGCTVGDVTLKIFTPDFSGPHRPYMIGSADSGTMLPMDAATFNLTRYARIVLYEVNDTVTYTSTVSTSAINVVDNYTVVGVDTIVNVDSTVTSRNQTTYINQTTYRYVDAARTILDNATSVPSVNVEVGAPAVMLVLLTPPPSSTTIRQNFDVDVQLVTEHGLPVAGSRVTATFIAPVGTNAKVSGVMQAWTNEEGLATLNLHFARGRSGNYTLLFTADAHREFTKQPSNAEANRGHGVRFIF